MNKMDNCCYNSFSCLNKKEFWVRRADLNLWFGLCKDHLIEIFKEEKKKEIELLKKRLNITELQKVRLIRLRNKRYKKDTRINWKMFIDWEELEYHSNIKDWDKSYGDINITIALQKHRGNALDKFKRNYII